MTLNNGTKASPTAEWKNDKDDNGTVTSKYLQITMPADAIAINFDMQLQYRTDEASYTKKVLVEAKAFEEEQDITKAAKRADESKENEATVVWEGQAVSQSESEAADEDADGENALNAVAEENQYTVYFQQSKISDPNWDNATQIYIYAFDNNNLGNISPMAKEGESNSQNVWKYTFNKAWTNVIFLTESDWPRDQSCQTVDLQINWKLNQPCFKLTGDDEQGTGKKKANQIAYQGTTQPADGITVYYDATLSKLSYAKTENVKNNGNGIPYSESDQVYYYATNGTKPLVELGTLKSSDELGGTNTIPDPQNPDHIKQITGYYPEYTKAEDGRSYNITNKKTGTLKIIKKAGKNDFLQGAEFTLYTDPNTTQVAKDHSGNELTGTTGENGELVFNNIKAGTEETPITYYLKEVKTKAGYVLLKEPIQITLPYKYKAGDIVNGNKVTKSGVTWNLTYTIINDKAFDLPASGNKGIFKFIVIGITAVLVGGYLLTARKKSRKKRVSRRV